MPRSITPVVFRKRKDTGTVIALFPDLPSDHNGYFCDAYEHVGQHGGADYQGVIANTTPAIRKESKGLAGELMRIGYRLKVMLRASRCHHEHRRQIALEWSSA